MTEILLVNPKSFTYIPSYLPYGLLYLAAYLRNKGFLVKIYDANTAETDFISFLKKENPAIIGISILSGPSIQDAIDKTKLIKKYLSSAKVVFGGIHTTIFPKQILSQNYVDYIIINEAEEAFSELCHHLLRKKISLKKIRNLGYKNGNQLIINKIRPFLNLDKLPLPAWDLVPMEKYIHHKFYSDRVTTLHTSRGCPWNCSFCYNRLVNFRKWRAMSAQRIIDQIEYLIKNYNIKGFQFYDDEFDVNPHRVEEFCHLLILKKIKIKWAHYSRVNVANLTRFLLEKRAGCEFIEFGVESGSSRILKFINKQQTVKQIKRAFSICHKAGIKTGAMFMTGLPTETKTDINLTVKLIKHLKPYQAINTIYRPYPGSDLFNYCLKNNLIKLPLTLEKQARFFDISTTEINVSLVSTNYLNYLYKKFFLYNLWQELKFCIKSRNFLLIFNHFKSRLSCLKKNE